MTHLTPLKSSFYTGNDLMEINSFNLSIGAFWRLSRRSVVLHSTQKGNWSSLVQPPATAATPLTEFKYKNSSTYQEVNVSFPSIRINDKIFSTYQLMSLENVGRNMQQMSNICSSGKNISTLFFAKKKLFSFMMLKITSRTNYNHVK